MAGGADRRVGPRYNSQVGAATDVDADIAQKP